MNNSDEAKEAIRKLTEEQRATFDQLCCGQLRAASGWVLVALVKAGLVVRRDRPRGYVVPTFVHIAWAQLCSKEFLGQVMANLEQQARKIAAKVNLDLDDPEVVAALSNCTDRETFNQRLDALLKKKRQGN